MRLTSFVFLAFPLSFAACAAAVPSQDSAEKALSPEVWSSADAPSIFDANLEYRLDSLPLTGQATNIPWASSYWPVYEDSINYRWDGDSSESAPKKYERAFGGTGVEDAVSKYHGIDAQSSRRACTSTVACADLHDGSECAKRPGATSGRCIPTWWGICHAWSPASILLPEPKNPVTVNGVTFKVNDLKALVTLVHNNTSSRFVSLRCERDAARDGLPDTSTTHFDNYGRPVDAERECRDTNPGTYHLLLANYLGIRKAAFVEDRTYASEVWNQPLRGYRFTQQREVSAAEANRLLGVTSAGGTTVSRSATVAKDVWAHQGSFPVTAGQSFVVRMTGTGDADLYVNFGAQPTDSAYACRPYGDNSTENCELTVPTGATQAFVSVKGYAATSSVKLDITSGGSTPTAYTFNKTAARFYDVKAEVDYISESSATTDGNLSSRIDQYTRTDRYEYILEVDTNGRIVGGEWVGASKTAHPDFLWLPTTVNGTSVAGGKITYAQVKGLLDQSVGPVTPPPASGTERTVNESATVAKGAWKQYGPFNVAAGGTLTATLSGSGDADLYVRRGAAPTETAYDCRPYAGTSAESCSAAGPAQVYVAVHGYATSSDVQLRVVYTEGGTVTPPPPATFTHLNTSGTLTQGEMKMFQLAVPAGRQLTIRTTSPVDIDLYTQFGQAPTTAAYLARGYTDSGNETLTYTATSAGTLFIGVHGYQAGSFTLVTSDN